MNESARTAGFMAMKGAGYYSRTTTGAKEVMDNATHLVIDAFERQAIMDEFYGRYQARVAAAPQGHAMDYVHAYLVCRKEA
jgi:hypothetical protein